MQQTDQHTLVSDLFEESGCFIVPENESSLELSESLSIPTSSPSLLVDKFLFVICVIYSYLNHACTIMLGVDVLKIWKYTRHPLLMFSKGCFMYVTKIGEN